MSRPRDVALRDAIYSAIAGGLAEALNSELLFAYVIPKRGGPSRRDAHHTLDAMIRSAPARLRPAMAISRCDAAAEIARLARERHADVIVMGLHSSPTGRQHMGHVTYALLCHTPTVVLAWPPARPENTLLTKRTKDVVIV